MNVSSPTSCLTTLASQDQAKIFAHEWRASGYSDSELSTCVCNTIYGPGNPDISGIGVRIALQIQAASYLLFGVVPTFASFFLRGNTKPSTETAIVRFQDLFVNVFRTSSLFFITSFIAAWTRLSQKPPTFEVGMIHKLLVYEIVLHLLAIVVFSARKIPTRFRTASQRWTYCHTSFAMATACVLFLTVEDRIALALPRKTLQGWLTQTCSASGQYPVVDVVERQVLKLSWSIVMLMTTLASSWMRVNVLRKSPGLKRRTVEIKEERKRRIVQIEEKYKRKFVEMEEEHKRQIQERTAQLVSTYVSVRVRLWTLWWKITVAHTPDATTKSATEEAAQIHDLVLEPAFRTPCRVAHMAVRCVRSAPELLGVEIDRSSPESKVTVPKKALLKQRLSWVVKVMRGCKYLLQEAVSRTFVICVNLFYDPGAYYETFRIGITISLIVPLNSVIICMAYHLAIQDNIMRHRIGAADIDAQWGFGQVAAILIWLPVGVQTVRVIFFTLFPGQAGMWLQRVISEVQEAIGELPVCHFRTFDIQH